MSITTKKMLENESYRINSKTVIPFQLLII